RRAPTGRRIALVTGLVGSENYPYIDGDQGILRYRGYPIDQVASNCSSVRSSTFASS
ncbi:hypothetical protein IAE22_31670, partial [Bacillus sp. S34]|nr:hypothetical protein [Bacillus sp. S34]